MSILAKCPFCHEKQSIKNKICKCGADLDKAKRSKKVVYYIAYRIPGKKNVRKERIGASIDKARTADAKRKVQRSENPLGMLPDNNLTFSELTEWYTGLKKVRKLAMYNVLKIHLSIFNDRFGDTRINTLVKTDLEDLQVDLQDQGFSHSYIDQIIGSTRTMVNKAIDDRKISGDCLYPFRKLRKLLKKNANARNLIWTMEQYEAVMAKASRHIQWILATGYWTGMREDEILSLIWPKVDLKTDFINLDPSDTKDDEPRLIPILPPLHDVLQAIPRAIHNNHVFLYRGKPIKDIRTALYNAMEKVDVPYGRKTRYGLIFHDLRHTYVTNMRRAGVPESVIMKITGHNTREMFDRYNLVDKSDADQAAGLMMDYISKFEVKKKANRP